MKIADQLVQGFMEGEWDRTPLNRESFPVNMRLYRVSASYRKIILEIVRYMDEHLRSHFEDYPDPKGVAAANLGFPFKIIGYKKNTLVGARPQENQFCLNPVITYHSQNTMTTHSNCGSLQLKEQLIISRHVIIDFEYYDLEGNLIVKKSINRADGGFTIQNAVDQCNGLTIIDRHNKEKRPK